LTGFDPELTVEELDALAHGLDPEAHAQLVWFETLPGVFDEADHVVIVTGEKDADPVCGACLTTFVSASGTIG
jgi:hypothetical protein